MPGFFVFPWPNPEIWAGLSSILSWWSPPHSQQVIKTDPVTRPLQKLKYSSVLNRRACTFINFKKQFPPARPYFGLHIYWFWRKIPPWTFIAYCMCIGICLARLLILGKNFPRHGLISVCKFNVFKNFSACTFIFPYRSIRHTKVDAFNRCFFSLLFSLGIKQDPSPKELIEIHYYK